MKIDMLCQAKSRGDNIYWEAAKIAFALAGGASAAVALMVGGYRLVGRASKKLKEEMAPPPLTDDDIPTVTIVPDNKSN